jgi:hypothetical protein
MPRILKGRTMVCIDRNLHLDHAIELVRATARHSEPGGNIWQQRLRVQFGLLSASTYEPVTVPTGVLRHDWAGGCDIYWQHFAGAIVDCGIPSAEVRSVERNPILAPKCTDQADCFLEARSTFLRVRPDHGRRRNLVQRFTPTTPSMRRPGYITPSVPNAWATTAG